MEDLMNQNSFAYPTIDPVRTGMRIKEECAGRGLAVRDLQGLLGLSAFQSIYDWFSGRTLPSLDNLIALSRLLDVPMDRLIICRGPDPKTERKTLPVIFLYRVFTYWKGLFRMKVVVGMLGWKP